MFVYSTTYSFILLCAFHKNGKANQLISKGTMIYLGRVNQRECVKCLLFERHFLEVKPQYRFGSQVKLYRNVTSLFIVRTNVNTEFDI